VWLSVIVPTYNGERYIAECLSSIEQNDTVRNIEVIVIDDGSTDATCNIVRSYQPRFNLTLVEQDHTGNWTIGTNRGMEMATGEYMCWLHQDDRWESHRLATFRDLVAKFPDAGLFLDSSWFVCPKGERIRRWTCPLPSNRMLQPDYVVPRFLVQCFVASCCPVFSTKLAREIGILDESLWFLADWDFWLRLASLTRSVNSSMGPSCEYRIHSAAQTVFRSQSTEDLQRQYHSVLQKYDNPKFARVASFSAKTNLDLFQGFHHGAQISTVFRLLTRFVALWPTEQIMYLRYSRMFERLAARRRFMRYRSTGQETDAISLTDESEALA